MNEVESQFLTDFSGEVDMYLPDLGWKEVTRVRGEAKDR